MEDFCFYAPTKCILQRNAEKMCGEEIRKKSDNVLFVHYGNRFMFDSGLYQSVMDSIKQAGVKCFELSGVQPNPRVSLVREGIRICKENEIRFILAVGGGSVIDTAKAVALGVFYEGDVWDFFCQKAVPQAALPVGCIMTLPATGSEGSLGSVIRNEELMETRDVLSDLIRPEFVLMNPELTYGIPKQQTVYGIIDMFTHVAERYFSDSEDVELTDRLCEGIMKAIIQNAPEVLEHPDDYNLRAEFMWTSVIAHNGLVGTGRKQDWSTHNMGAQLGALYDIPHGATLSVLLPYWAEFVYKNYIPRFAQFAERVFDVTVDSENLEEAALEGIRRLRMFLNDLEGPSTMGDIGISDNLKFKEMAKMACQNGTIGCIRKLTPEDVEHIYGMALLGK